MSIFDMNNAVNAAFNGEIPKYAIYLRKSRKDIEAEERGEGETLARHKKILTEFAARKGLYVAEIYQEIISGAESIKDRPEITRLIQDCYAGKYRGIIIMAADRLCRGNQGDAQMILDMLKYANHNNGLLILTPSRVYDIAHNSDDEDMLEFELFFARKEYKTIKKRMDIGKHQSIVEGDYMGSYRPYGYDIVKTKTSRTLIPNPEEAPIVKKIFEWAVKDGHSAGQIARTLTTMGVPTYTGKQEWNGATIKCILMNPTYKGKVRWNDRMQVKTMVNGELVASRPRSNHTDHYMEFDGKHKKYALVDDETFEAAKSKYYSDRTKADFKLQNPLAGIFKCKHCGKMMLYQQYKNRPTTEPRFLHKSSQICKVKSVLAKDVMNALVHSLKLYIEDFETRVDNLPDVDENSIMEQMEALRVQLRKVEKKLAQAFDDYEDRIYTANEFVERKAIHNAKIEAIKKQMAILEDSIPEKEEYEDMVFKLSEALNALLDEDLDADVKNHYLKGIIDRIEFSRENNEEFIIDVFLR